MFLKASRCATFNRQPAAQQTRCHLFGVGLATLFAASLCVLLGACSDDTQSAASATAHTLQNRAATQAFAPPARMLQSPAPASSEVGAAASDSLVTPIIHTVD
jgi:hypothetical protein